MVTYHFSSDSPLAKPFMILFIVVIGVMVAYVLRWLKDRQIFAQNHHNGKNHL